LETSAYVKKLLREAWKTASLSQIASLLTCNYGTAYRCLEEAGCFKPAPAGKPTRRDVDILSRHPKLTDALATRGITARRYFNCIGYPIETLETEPNDEYMIHLFEMDLPEALGLPPLYHNQKGIRLDLTIRRGKNGVPCCYSEIYYGILGRGKTDATALYHAQLSFRQLSHKGRLELYIQEGFEAALNWEPMKRSKVKFKPELKLDPEPPPITVEDMKRTRQALINEYNSISSGNTDAATRRKQEICIKVSSLEADIMSIEDPEKYRLESMVRVLTNKVINSRKSLHEANSNPERFEQLEKIDIDLKKQLSEAEKALKQLFIARKSRV